MDEWEAEKWICDGRRSRPLVKRLCGSERLPMVFQFWMAELSRELLRLGVYFRAVGIMLQIPGGADYEWVADEQVEGDEYDENKTGLWDLIDGSSRDTVFNVLAECLHRLRSPDVMAWLPEAEFVSEELSPEWKELLDKREPVQNGLLSVVGECLDALLIRPGRKAIEQGGKLPWWEEWRARPPEGRRPRSHSSKE